MSEYPRPKSFADAEAILAERMEDYESRPQQQALAQAVEEAIANRRHLLAEAGTGTGKSLGYLIPAILSGKRVIVSTATKALQDQIALKDVPFLQENLVPFKAALLKGRSNYVCWNRLADAEIEDQMKAAIGKVIEERYEDLDFTGEKDEFGFDIPWKVWNEICSESDECRNCDEACYAFRARKRALLANVVIVNHALYMTELLVQKVTGGNATFLGEHEVVVFDEAHELEEYASKTLTGTIRQRGVENLMGEIDNFTRQYDTERTKQAGQLTAQARSAAVALWKVLKEGRIKAPDLLDRADEFVDFTNALYDLCEFMAEKWPRTTTSPDQAKKRGSRVRRKVESMYETMSKIVRADFGEVVRWVESETRMYRGQRETVLSVHHAPIYVAPELRQMLFETQTTAILTSATLMTSGGMEYIAGRLGVDAYDSLDVGTPFDYPTQARLYIPTDIPQPIGEDRAAWSVLATQRMRDLIKASRGRALLLFTSYTEMKNAYESIAPNSDYPCKMQGGDEDNKALAAWFKSETNSVLFATRSFMTGFDVQGDSLSLVVINKLPFPVPTEPLIEARTEAIEASGGDPFKQYSIPVMILVLKQAFGRLIRHRNDRGVVAILDPRLMKKWYGAIIRKALPDAPVTHDLADVEAMYEEAVPV